MATIPSWDIQSHCLAFKAIHESEVLNMRGIGGNAVADIQVKSITRNEIGEQEVAWVSEDT